MLRRMGWKLNLVGKILTSNPDSQDSHVFKTKKLTNFVKAILFKVDQKEPQEGHQTQSLHVGFY